MTTTTLNANLSISTRLRQQSSNITHNITTGDAPLTTTSNSTDTATIVAVVATTLLFLLVTGIIIVQWRKCRREQQPFQVKESPRENLSSIRGAFVSSIFLHELKTSKETPEKHPESPKLATPMQMMLPESTSFVQLSQSRDRFPSHYRGSLRYGRTSELFQTGLGSVDESITESSSNILGSFRTDQTLSAAESNILSTFRSQETSSVEEPPVLLPPAKPRQQLHASVTEGSYEGTTHYSNDFEVMRPDPSSSEGLNQVDYYQWAKSMAAFKKQNAETS